MQEKMHSAENKQSPIGIEFGKRSQINWDETFYSYSPFEPIALNTPIFTTIANGQNVYGHKSIFNSVAENWTLVSLLKPTDV